jgi:ribonucleoside-diphosphate reductase alpha chain
MKLTENALKVLEKRYFRKDENGVLIEDWDKMLTRVASNIASGDEEKTHRFYQLMDAGYFYPILLL